MPLTYDETREYARLKGFNPDEVDVDALTGAITPKRREQPTMSTAIPAPKTPGALETIGRQASLSVLPSAVSIPASIAVGGAVTAKALPLAAAGPWIPPVLGIAAGLGTGLAASMGASKLQESLLSQIPGGQEYLAKSSALREERPVASAIGDVAGSLPFMKVNPKMLKDAAHALTTERAAGAGFWNKLGQSEAAQNVVISGALGGATSVGEDLMADKDVNVTKALVNAVMQGAVSDVHPWMAKIPGLRNAPYRGQPLAEPAPNVMGVSEVERTAILKEPAAGDEAAKLTKQIEELDKQIAEMDAIRAEQEKLKAETPVLQAKLELKRMADEKAALEKALKGDTRTYTEFVASPENMAFTTAKAQEKGVADVTFEDTGRLTGKRGETYGEFDAEKNAIRASTYAGTKGKELNLPERAVLPKDVQAAPTTGPHETIHAEIYNILNSERAAQTRIGEQLRVATENSPEYKRWLETHPDKTWDEYATIRSAAKFALDPSNKGRSWAAERAALKRLQTGKATADDVDTILLMKWRYDRGLAAPRGAAGAKAPVRSAMVDDVNKEIERLREQPATEQLELPMAKEGTPLTKWLRDNYPEFEKPQFGDVTKGKKFSTPEGEKPATKFNPDAIRRRNIEPDGKVYQSGKLVEPTKDMANMWRAGVAVQDARIAKLRELEAKYPNADISEMRRIGFEEGVVEADTDAASWKDVIRQVERSKADRLQYAQDIEDAANVFARTKGISAKPAASVTKAAKPPKAVESDVAAESGFEQTVRSAEQMTTDTLEAKRKFAAKHPKLISVTDAGEIMLKTEPNEWGSAALSDWLGVTPGALTQYAKKQGLRYIRDVDWNRVIAENEYRPKQYPQLESKGGKAKRDESGAVVMRERPLNEKIDPSKIFWGGSENAPVPDDYALGVIKAGVLEALMPRWKSGHVTRRARTRWAAEAQGLDLPEGQRIGAYADQLANQVLVALSKEGLNTKNLGENPTFDDKIFKNSRRIAERMLRDDVMRLLAEKAEGTTSLDAPVSDTRTKGDFVAAPVEPKPVETTPTKAGPAKEIDRVEVERRQAQLDQVVKMARDGAITAEQFDDAEMKLRKRFLDAGLSEREVNDILSEARAAYEGRQDDLRGEGAGDVDREYQAQSRQSTPEPDETPTFVTQFEKELRVARPFALQVGKDGRLLSSEIIAKLRTLPAIEQELLRNSGLEDKLKVQSRISAEDLKRWLDENGPKVEVLNYGMEGKVSEAKREYDRMTHEWYDNLSGNTRNKLLSYRNSFEGQEFIDELVKDGFDREHATKAAKYFDLRDTVSVEQDSSPRATSYYKSVSALPTEEPMPEWTKSKDSKNVQRVDVVIPSKYGYDKLGTQAPKGKSDVLWHPDNLHENVPNTLGWAMIQYKDGPNGERIALIAEAQSRWGQHLKKQKGREAEFAEFRSLAPDHPLLRDYNRLILKAAIDQARKENATHIVVSDAETAMMTEGHDTQQRRGARINPANWSPTGSDTGGWAEREPRVGDWAVERENGWLTTYPSKDMAQLAKETGKMGHTVRQVVEADYEPKVEQEGGMRFNYDASYVIADKDGQQISDKRFATADEAARYAESQMRMKPASKYPKDWKGPRDEADYKILRGDLPSIMTEITGDEGTRVSLGEHKNAFDETMNRAARGDLAFRIEDTAVYDPEESAKVQAKRLMEKNGLDYAEPYVLKNGRRYFVQYADYDTMLSLVSYPERAPRENLIFRNADGSPKTDVSGTMFDISAPAARRASGEEFSIAGKRYSSPEADDATAEPAKTRHIGGSDVMRAMSVFGTSMYDKSPELTIIKELTQNARDAVVNSDTKALYLSLDDDNNTITLADTGSGMTPTDIVEKYLPAFVTGKNASEAAGGYGLAKIGLFANSEQFTVKTVADSDNGRLKSELVGSGEAWLRYVNEGVDVPLTFDTPGTYDFSGMSLRVSYTDEPLGTAVSIKPKKEVSLWDVEYEFKQAGRYAKDEQFYVEKSYGDHLFDGKDYMRIDTERNKYNTLMEESVDGATVSLLFDSSAEPGVVYNIPVLNNGLKQFTLPFSEDVKLPPIIVDIKPNVEVTDPNYPFTPNRDAIKAETNTFVERAIKSVASKYKQKQLDVYRERIESVKDLIPGTKRRFMDISGKLSKQAKAEIIENEITQEIDGVLASTHKAIFNRLNKRYGEHWTEASYNGLANGGGFYGVRFGVPRKGSKGEMYYDIGLALKDVQKAISEGKYQPDEIGTALGEHVAGTVLHEVAHQISHYEGETHAKAMTSLAGLVAGDLTKVAKKLGSLFDGDNWKKLTEYANRYEKLTENAKASESEADTIIRKGQSQSREGSEDAQVFRATEDSSRNRVGSNIEISNFDEDVKPNIRYSSPEPEGITYPDQISDFSKQGPVERFAAQFDQVRKYDTKVADAFVKAELLREINEGQYLHSTVHDFRKEFGSVNERELKRAYDYALGMYRNPESVDKSSFTKREIALASFWNERISRPVRKHQQDLNMEVETRDGLRRKAKLSEWYAPEMLNDKAIDVFTKSTDTTESTRLKNLWVEHVVEMSANTDKPISSTDARKDIDQFVSALGRRGAHAADFGALRKAAGFGLPEELRERNLLRVMERYARRASRDLAKVEGLEIDPYVRGKLLLDDPATGERGKPEDGNDLLTHEEVRNAMKFITGDFEINRSPRLLSTVRAVTNAMLGPMTGVRDTATVIVNSLPYMKFSDLPTIFTSLSDFNTARRKSLEYGARTGKHPLDAIATPLGTDAYVNTFNIAAEALRKYSGRDAIEQFNRIWTFAIGRELANQAVLTNNTDFIKKFGMAADQQVDGKTVWNTDIMAKNFTDRVQGSYGGRGLPAIAVDGMAAPWFALARWSLEKANITWNDVLKPAYTGKDFTPLLMYTVGAWLTGEAIEKLNEELQAGKKSQDASWKEIEAADGGVKQVALRLANIMQLGSFLGITGDMLKMGADIAKGEKPRGYSVPLADFISDGVVGSVTNFSRAVQDGADPLDAVAALTQNLARTQLQAYRVANYWVDREQVDRSNKFRDLRVFKQTTGREVPSDIQQINPAMREDEREFKRSSDPLDAASRLRDVLDRFKVEYKDDPAAMSKALERLRRNSYQTFPSPDRDLREAQEYYNYLVRAYGKAEADARVEDYMRQTQLNRMKSTAIPTLSR